MQIHQIQRKHPNKRSRQVGRGGKRGKTSGRGTKGQKARAGRKLRPEMRDIIKKFPKRRGYGKNRGRTVNSSSIKYIPVNLAVIDKVFEDGETVSPATLVEKGVVEMRGGRPPRVKILGTGEISKSLAVSDCPVSASAKEKIEKAGGGVK